VVLREVVRQVYDLAGDDRRFRDSALADNAGRIRNFDRLRSHYPERREFQYTTVKLIGGTPSLRRILKDLGFKVE
jgi:hypothetical protein